MVWNTSSRSLGQPVACCGFGSALLTAVQQPGVDAEVCRAHMLPTRGIDGGEVFSTARGYGWTANLTGQTRDRDSTPDQRRDTLIHCQTATWEIVVPNGEYNVDVYGGDAGWPDGTYSCNVEGVAVFTNVVANASNKFFEGSALVSVSDGRLSLDDTGSPSDLKLNYIVITPAIINLPPSGSFTASPSSGTVPLTVHFDGSGSSDPDGTIVLYEWDYNYDGSTFTIDATGPTSSYLYASTGIYVVALRVTDNDSLTNVVTKTITVNPVVLTYAVSGLITIDGTSDPLQGVAMTLSGASNATTTTDVNGDYSFANLANGNYTITPSLSGYAFDPASLNITVSGANVNNQDFDAIPDLTPTYSVSGTLTTDGTSDPLQGVAITLSGASSATTTTDVNGDYSFANLANGNYTITPSLSGYAFDPASINITVSGANVNNQDFDAAVEQEQKKSKNDTTCAIPVIRGSLRIKSISAVVLLLILAARLYRRQLTTIG